MKAIVGSGISLSLLIAMRQTGARTLMGAKLDNISDDFNPSFCVENCIVYIILDPSHMIKKMRGAIDNNKKLLDAESRSYKWVSLLIELLGIILNME